MAKIANTNALVASASEIKLEDRGEIQRLAMRKEKWQQDAWEMYDNVAEFGYGVDVLADTIARLTLFVAKRPKDPTEVPSPMEEINQLDEQVLAPLASPVSGHGDLLRALAQNLLVPGECFLMGRNARTPSVAEPAMWDVYSTEEVKADSSGQVKIRTAKDWELVTETKDRLTRIWIRHPRNGQLAHSAARRLLDIGEEILLIQRTIRAAARSRIASNGLLFLSSKLSFGSIDHTRDGQDGSAAQDPFIQKFTETAVANIRDEGVASAVVPIIVRGEGLPDEMVKFIAMANPADEKLLARLEHAIRRLATGMNLPAEVITGLGDISHWGQWFSDENMFKAHAQPLAIAICDALSRALLPDKPDYMIWYDSRAVTSRPNRSEDTKYAYDNELINNVEARAGLGFADVDAPTDEERLTRLVLEKGSLDPALTQALLAKMLGLQLEVTPSSAAPAPPAPAPPAAPAAAQPAPNGPPAVAGSASADIASASDKVQTWLRDIGQRMSILDARLRERLWVSADAEMTRALERIGSRLRSLAKKDPTALAAIASVANIDVAATLGVSMVNQLGADGNVIFEESVAVLAPKFERWVAEFQAHALELVPGLDDAAHQAYSHRQATERAAAWTWLSQQLLETGKALIYNPHPDPKAGSLRIDYSMIREAVARAGGAK